MSRFRSRSADGHSGEQVKSGFQPAPERRDRRDSREKTPLNRLRRIAIGHRRARRRTRRLRIELSRADQDDSPIAERASAPSCRRFEGSGGLWQGEALAAHVHDQGVDAERVRDHVQRLATVPDTVRPPQPQRVIEMPVDALGVVASPVQHFEVRIARRDLPHILRPVELALRVLCVRMHRCCGACGPGRAARTPACPTRSPPPNRSARHVFVFPGLIDGLTRDAETAPT